MSKSTPATFACALSINRLRLAVKLGVQAGERIKAQPVEVDIRFFFPSTPDACHKDEGEFICYDEIGTAIGKFVAAREFKLIEYLSTQIFNVIRAQVKDTDIKIWLRLNKCVPPVPNMLGGASFTVSDLPPGAETGNLI